MKAMVLNAPTDLAEASIADAVNGEGEVLVKVTRSGVCGTDLKIFQGQISVAYPRVMGHEMIGEIVDAGNASGITVGKRVIVDPVIFCGKCFHCQAGRENLCPNGHLIGRDCDGGFSEFVSVPADAVVPLPDNISDDSAPLIQVMTTCLHAQNLAPVQSGESIAIIGLGVAGQLQVQLAKARGAGLIVGITGSAARRSLAEKFGADVTLAPGDDVAEEIRALTGGHGVDMVIECAGAMSAFAQAIDIARPGARLLLFGIYTATEASLPFYELYYKELSIISARAARRADFPACVDLVGSGEIDLDSLISHVLPLSELSGAIRMLEERDDSRLKVVLDHSH
jgi:2-desacetyl-2-hydroxyethyl bacteriochlorophyllide A dehydrogenase